MTFHTHYETFPFCTISDIIPVLDRVQRSSTMRTLSGDQIKRALQWLDYYSQYGTCSLELTGGYRPTYFHYAVPCTVLHMVHGAGGYAQRIDAPERAPGSLWSWCELRLVPRCKPIPRDSQGLYRAASVLESSLGDAVVFFYRNYPEIVR